MAERLFTAYQIADLLGATPGVVAGWIQVGRLESQRLPDGQVRISERQLVRFLKQEGIDMEQILAKSMAEEKANGAASNSGPAGGVYGPTAARAAPGSERPSVSRSASAAPVDETPERAPLSLPAAQPQPQPVAAADAERAEPAEPAAEPLAEPPASSSESPVTAPADSSPPQSEPPAAAAPANKSPATAPANSRSPQPSEEPVAIGQDKKSPAAALANSRSPQPSEEPVAIAQDKKSPAKPKRTRNRSARKPAPPRPLETPEDPAAQITEAIITDAVARGATAMHLEQVDQSLRLRLRLDGMLQEKAGFRRNLPDGLGPRVVEHLRARAGLNGSTAGPQAGRIEMTVADRPLRLGLSALPTQAGDRIVIRISEAHPAAADLSEIGLAEQQAERVRALLAEPYGLIVVAGPPRNGISRTLRAMLAHLADGRRSVLCAERSAREPIEGVTHCIVDRRNGLAWSDVMRAAADQDVDVVGLEDIGEPQTAAAALDAACDGVMVVGGLSVGSFPAALEMLRRMGLDPWPLAATLRGIITQRSVRLLCGECKKRSHPSAKLMAEIGLDRSEIEFPVFGPRGCATCGEVGYLGQAMLFSVTAIDDGLADLLRDGADAAAIAAAAQAGGAGSLLDAGMEQLRQGNTSIEELIRARVR